MLQAWFCLTLSQSPTNTSFPCFLQNVFILAPFQLQLIYLSPWVHSGSLFYPTTQCCVVSVCWWSGAGSLSSGREAMLTHTHGMRTSGLAFPTTAPPPLYQHTRTNKLIHTPAPSNRLLSLLAQPLQSNTHTHTHTYLHTSAWKIIAVSNTKCPNYRRSSATMLVKKHKALTFTTVSQNKKSQTLKVKKTLFIRHI